MIYISKEKKDNIIKYLGILEKNIKEDDTILSINEIKKDLTEDMILSKSDILDELNDLIILTSSLREQVFILCDNEKKILVNTEIYTYAIYKNLEYLQNQLFEILSSIENLTIKKDNF